MLLKRTCRISILHQLLHLANMHFYKYDVIYEGIYNYLSKVAQFENYIKAKVILTDTDKKMLFSAFRKHRTTFLLKSNVYLKDIWIKTVPCGHFGESNVCGEITRLLGTPESIFNMESSKILSFSVLGIFGCDPDIAKW